MYYELFIVAKIISSLKDNFTFNDNFKPDSSMFR